MTYKIMTIEDFKEIKSETRKYQIMARHLEHLTINSDIESIRKIEENNEYKPYIKYIGSIGNSRALQFCVSKECNEKEAIKTIEYIVKKIKGQNNNITAITVAGMLNIAIIYEKEEIIEYLLRKKELKSKINFAYNDYMIVKNMTNNVNKEEKRILKKLIIEKVIPLDKKTRNIIEKSKDEEIIGIIKKIDLKEKIESNLQYKEIATTKKIKI